MNRHQLQGAAAVLIIAAAALYTLTETVWPAVVGLALVIVAAMLLFQAHRLR